MSKKGILTLGEYAEFFLDVKRLRRCRQVKLPYPTFAMSGSKIKPQDDYPDPLFRVRQDDRR